MLTCFVFFPPQSRSINTFQSYYQGALKTARSPSALFQSAQNQPSAVAQQIRGVSRAQVIATGVILAECLGFFTVGEMIGRFKIIGYHGESASHH
jgi:F-type H+-transporting ATPase subunit g